MSKIRLSSLAKTLNKTTRDLVNDARKIGIVINDNPNSIVDDAIFNKMIDRYGDENINKGLNDKFEQENKKIKKNSKSNLVTIIELFENKIFRIPDYQRGFSWSERELDALWKDLRDITGTSKHFTGIISLEAIDENTKIRFSKEEYIGEKSFNENLELILDNEVYTPFFIVDGQQRLTSLMILLTVLLDDFTRRKVNISESEEIRQLIATKESEVYKFGYEKDTPSHQFLLSEIFKDEKIKVTEPETIYTKNLIKAMEFFKEKISPKESNEDDENYKGLRGQQKKNLFNIITNNLLFNVLILDNKVVDISMVFETLNYRGKPLSKLEILKNRLMFLSSKRLKGNPEKIISFRQEITESWLHLYEWLGKSKSSINQIDDDSFLRAFWIMYFNHDNRKETRFSEFEVDLFDNKYKINEVEQNNLLSEESLKTFLSSIKKAVIAWHYIAHPENDNQSNEVYVNSDFTYYLQLLNKIEQGRYVRPMIMAILSQSYDSDILEDKTLKTEIIKSIEQHNTVLFLINGKSADTNRAQSWRFANLIFSARKGRELCDKYSGKTSLDITKFLYSSMQTNTNRGNFFDHIYSNRVKSEQFWDWNGRDYILLQYEWYLNDKPINERNLDLNFQTYRIYNNDYSVRFHTSFFKDLHRSSKESRLIIQNSIGNIFIGKPSNTNISFKNSKLEFENEKKFLTEKENSTIKIDSWNYSKIMERGFDILSFIEVQYGISFGDDSKKRMIILNGLRDN